MTAARAATRMFRRLVSAALVVAVAAQSGGALRGAGASPTEPDLPGIESTAAQAPSARFGTPAAGPKGIGGGAFPALAQDTPVVVDPGGGSLASPIAEAPAVVAGPALRPHPTGPPRIA